MRWPLWLRELFDRDGLRAERIMAICSTLRATRRHERISVVTLLAVLDVWKVPASEEWVIGLMEEYEFLGAVSRCIMYPVASDPYKLAAWNINNPTIFAVDYERPVHGGGRHLMPKK